MIEQAEDEYDAESRVLYWFDRGMTLHLSGRYEESNEMLERAESRVEELYTSRISTEAVAFLVNDTELPYEGQSYEQTMINVIKALNYALMGDWDDSLVEARRIDHRLNVLADRVGDAEGYRDDALARYLTGILYEATRDLNNAFIAYRKAFEVYRDTHTWSQASIPTMLRSDLLRVTDSLHLRQEHDEYRRLFPDVSWQSATETQQLARLVFISYNGRAPYLKDQFIDVPVSLDALKLVLLTKQGVRNNPQDARAAESVIYGLSGQVVRVALPRLVPQKTHVAYGELNLARAGYSVEVQTELVQDIHALAARDLEDRFPAIATKAVARAVVKYSVAEGMGHGARIAAGDQHGGWVGLLVGIVAKMIAVASEEADKRSWRTLPDEIQLAQLWVPAGHYTLRLRTVGEDGTLVREESVRLLTLHAGETRIVTERALL